MKRSTRVLGLATLGLFLLLNRSVTAQQTANSPSIAPLWSVHIDEVQPRQAAEFERLNIAENRQIHAIMRAHGQPIKPVYEVVTAGSVYMSLRPKLSLTDFDTPSTIPDSVSALFTAVTDSLDAPIHAALKTHYNQIWRYQRASSYDPEMPGYHQSTPGYIQLTSERVIPRQADLYSALVDSLNYALKKSNYPWGVLLFSSSYGDGCYKYLWQADSKEQFLKAGDRAAVFAAVFGKKNAQKMLAEWRSCLASSETVDAAPRRDYADLDSSEVWLGMRK